MFIRNGQTLGSVLHEPEGAGDVEEPQSGADDLSKLRKDELVELAEAAGVDSAGKTKARLVEALEGGDV